VDDQSPLPANHSMHTAEQAKHVWLYRTVWIMGLALFLKVALVEIKPIVQEFLIKPPGCSGNTEIPVAAHPTFDPRSAASIGIEPVPVTVEVLSDGTLLVVTEAGPVLRIMRVRPEQRRQLGRSVDHH
jgi:hypothetical protein